MLVLYIIIYIILTFIPLKFKKLSSVITVIVIVKTKGLYIVNCEVKNLVVRKKMLTFARH